MEYMIVLWTIACSLLLGYALHLFQKKRNSNRHIGDVFFTSILIVSLVIFPISIFMVGGWNGLFISVVGVYLFSASFSGLILTKILKKYN